MPGIPGADLVVVESDFVLAGSEALFDGPACSGHVDELSEPCMVWVVAVVERELTVVDGSADQVLVVGVIGVGKCPVIDAEPLRSDTAGSALPRVGGNRGASASNWRVFPVVSVNRVVFGTAITYGIRLFSR